MTELEKAEKLREKTGVSYTEAKEALENSDGSVLDALVYLEKQGKAQTPAGGGFYSGAGSSGGSRQSSALDKKRFVNEGETLSDLLKRFGRFCLRLLDKGMVNHLVASKKGRHLFSVPVIVFIVLVLFFWVTIPIFIITLFCGIRYQLRGPDLERDAVNNVMDSASNIVDDVKRTFTDEVRATKNAYESKKSEEADVAGEANEVNEETDSQRAKDDDEVVYY